MNNGIRFTDEFKQDALARLLSASARLVLNKLELLKSRHWACKTRSVRRQGFWHQWQLNLRESLAHLVGFIMRRVVCDASVAFQASFV